MLRARAAIYLLLLGHTLALIWAAISSRVLYGDGAAMFIVMRERYDYFFDYQFDRKISYLPQILPILYARHFGELASNSTFILLAGLSYLLHPLVALAICFLLLRLFKKSQFFLFPVLSFALCSQGLSGYPTLVQPETLSVYWILLTLILTREGRYFWEVPMGLLLCLGMAHSYETAIVLMVVNILILALRLKRGMTVRGDGLLLLGSVYAIALLVMRFVGPEASPASRFVEGLAGFGNSNPFRNLGLILSLGLGLGILFKRAKWVLIATAAIGGIYFVVHGLIQTPGANLYTDLWWARTTIIPMSALIALSFTGAAFFWNAENWKANSAALSGVVLVALLLSLLHDLRLTQTWREGYAAIHKLRDANPGCNVISTQDFNDLFAGPYGFGAWWLPYVSLTPDGDRAVSSLFFAQDVPNGEPCGRVGHPVPLHLRPILQGLSERAKYWDYSTVLAGEVHVLKWNQVTGGFEKTDIPRPLIP